MTHYRTAIGPPVFLHHPSSLDHRTGNHHPERPGRITAIEHELARRGGLGYALLESPPVARSVLEAVHAPAHLAAIESLCAEGGGWLDVDTVVSAGSWEAALHAAGGAVALVDMLLEGEAPSGMSVHRPPGHHATAEAAMGFCLFDNVAVAARHALDAHALERVLVLDWDVHHGNGTNDIFAATDAVLVCSIHQHPLYPYSGAAEDRGHGQGAGHTINLPVAPASGDEVWCSLVEHVLAPVALRYEPQLLLVSAGYDAHADDPLAACQLTDGGFATMAGSVARLGAQLGVPVGAVLEGGYDLESLSRSVAETLAVLGAPAPPPAPALARHPLALAARERLDPRWLA